MLKYINSFFLIIIACLISTQVFAQQTSVLILPFTIHAKKELGYLKKEIPGIIAKQLKDKDITIIKDSANDNESISGNIDSYNARHLGKLNNASYVIWGSLTWFDKKYSIDTNLIKTFDTSPANHFYVEGIGIENLFGSVQKITKQITNTILEFRQVKTINIEGNKRIEDDAILRVIDTKPNDAFLAKTISKDIVAIYDMGYFDDVRVYEDEKNGEKILIFHVTEKPTLRSITVEGNKLYEEKEIKESLNISVGSILNFYKINDSIKRIKDLYKEKNYHNVQVKYKVTTLKHSQADLDFIINEGQKVQIKSITFEGIKAYTPSDLTDIMETTENGFFSWFTGSGELKMDDLNQDVAKIAAFYQNSGYIESRVGAPKVEYKGDWIYITIKIDEGKRFEVGKVNIEGNLLLPIEEMMSLLKIKETKYFNRQALKGDVLMLMDLYSDDGYAYAEVLPRMNKDLKKLKVNITFVIEKGKQVYFERIFITGNTKTRDKVIRRQLKVYEQELYKGNKLKQSVRKLYRLDYFEDVKVDTTKGSSDDKMILNIEVAEKPTGSFSFGGGYSNVDKMFGMVQVSQKNFLGYGQKLEVRAKLSGRSNQYSISFTEPWFLNIPLSAGIDVYKWDYDYDTYDKDSIGGGLRFSYPLFDFTRFYITYNYDVAELKDIEENAPISIKELKGENIESSISNSIVYDSRDKAFNPTRGSVQNISFEYAGLGGNIGFTKLLASSGWYIPIFWKFVGSINAKVGFVSQNTGMKLPDYERFYLGGINSMRGFDWQGIYVLDNEGYKIGGNKFIQGNAELGFPLFEDIGIYGVLFYDTGNVYGNGDTIDLNELRKSAGFGFRWYSPMGPIRVICGFILDPKQGEGSNGKWEFAMGTTF